MESIETLNERLIEYFGKGDNALPNYRIVHSDNEFEKRWVSHDIHGNELVSKIVELRPKYRQYIQNKYILERLIFVPPYIETDLVEDYSYEPLWTFQNNKGEAVPPIWEGIQLILDTVHKNAAKSIGAKYKDPELDAELSIELKKERVKKLRETLFGNETEVGDALAYKEGVVVPHNYGQVEKN